MQQKKSVVTEPIYYSNRLRKKLMLLAASRSAIVEAPSGCGKTTAMRSFLKDMISNDDDICWFNAVDEAPAALYRRFCAEVGKIDSRAGERLRKIDFPNAFTIGEACDALRSVECGRKTWLIIDDFQLLFDILPTPFLTAMLDNDREKLCVIVITRRLGQSLRDAIAGFGIQFITASDLQWDADDIRYYFSLAGSDIPRSAANEVMKITDGWIIAVHLQLCAYRDTGAFKDKAIVQLMENLIWGKMTREQQEFFMRLSVFDTCTVEQIRGVMGCGALPDYAADSLSIPFVRYIAEDRRYEPHSILLELVRIKRRAQGETFDKECLIRAGDVCRDEGALAEALDFYAQTMDYERMLSLELSNFVCVEIGERAFNDIALEIARNCPAEIRRRYPFAMLCVAWAVRFLENDEFGRLMNELDGLLPETGALRAEWLLLSAYLHYPSLEEMLPIVRKAAELFDGGRSNVIMPKAPWAFYEYLQLPAFHVRIGAADEEADMLEQFIGIYSPLTGGHGAGADALFRAELAFFRCDTANAEIFAYKAVFLAENKQQKIIQIGAARVLGSIALLKSDLVGWQRVVNAVEHAASGPVQNTSTFRRMLDVVRGTLLCQLRDYARIADWLKNTDFLFLGLPSSIEQKALAVHGYYLMGRGEYARLVGFMQTISLDKHTAFSVHFHYFTMAVGYLSLGDRTQAIACLNISAAKGLPDGMLHCFAGYSRLLQGLSDEIIKNEYPFLAAKFEDYKEKYYAGWDSLYNTIVMGELPSGLTEREHEVAVLAAEGLHNHEIAEKLFVSENTVRAHLRTIYQKLDIDRRAKLAKKLK